jgi:hypothetical protein
MYYIMSNYIRATGDNRYAGGSAKWLKIQGHGTAAVAIRLQVFFNGRKRYVDVVDGLTDNLEFAIGTWPNAQPCSWARMKKELGYVRQIYGK